METSTTDLFNETGLSNTTGSPGKTNSPWDDATWILTSAFIIFTMQSGFGLLESGMASQKNEVNIMLKNVVDVVFGGITYWGFGYGLTFGNDPGANGFTGVGHFFLNPDGENLGNIYSKFVFQASFATTATTIVSGAMAERTKLMAYIVFSLLNTLVYSFPAHWIWSEKGWLKRLNVVDIAGVGPVHLVGGVTALVAAVMLKPRLGRYKKGLKAYQHIPTSNPVNALLGLFMLWWGWLGFNCGSTFGISEGKWKLASRAAATTILSSCGGGITAFFISYVFHNKKYVIPLIVNGILGALVSISAICALSTTWAAIIIGSIGAMIACLSDHMLFRLKIDDPVGASSVHLFCSIWGLLCCGIFAQKDNIQYEFSLHSGLIWSGDWYLLGVQTLAVVVVIVWSATTSTILLKVIDLTIGLRVSTEEELVGADFVEHNIIPSGGMTPDLVRVKEEMARQKASQSFTTDLKSCFTFLKRKSTLEVSNKSKYVANEDAPPNVNTKSRKKKKSSKGRPSFVSPDDVILAFDNKCFTLDEGSVEGQTDLDRRPDNEREDESHKEEAVPVDDIKGD